LEHEKPAVSQTERNKVAPDPLTGARSHFRTLGAKAGLGITLVPSTVAGQRTKKGECILAMLAACLNGRQ
ncbi:hypothetical protein DVA81_19685, partial [Acinetobacter baumannii]